MTSESAGRWARGLWVGVALAALATAAFAETTQYTYDSLGRLISAIDQSGKKVVYTYDSAGNRTRLSNGAEYAEIIPTAFSASSNAGTTGLATAGALRDSDFTALASIHATLLEAGAWIKADLGSAKSVNHLLVAPALASSVMAGPEDLNGAIIEYSLDGVAWTTASTINAASSGTSLTVALGGVSLRYLRLRRPGMGQVAVGDLRLFSAAVLGSPLIAQPDSITNNGATSVTFDPRTNDRAPGGQPFTISAVDDPPHGLAIVNSGVSITYTPDVGYVGGDTFNYTITDGSTAVASAQIVANVTAVAGPNHNPTAVNDTVTVPDRISAAADAISVLRPLLNDDDPDHDLLSVSAVGTPSHGAAGLAGGGLVTYQPVVGYTGPDSFTYTASDGRGGTSIATISLTVANQAPIAVDDVASMDRNTVLTFDPRINDTDADGDALAMSVSKPPANGGATVNGAGTTLSYSPTSYFVGADAFSYTVSDGRGGTATANVVVLVRPAVAAEVEVMQPNLYGAGVTASGAVFTIGETANAKTNVYIDRPVSTGKVYWEVKLSCGALTSGVSANVASAANYGGFSNTNAGIHTGSAQVWTSSAAASGLGVGQANDIYGFALDADAHSLKIYRNNTAGPTLSLPFSGPYYPHAGFQTGYTASGQTCTTAASAGEFKFGAGNTTYAPPSGYSAMSDPSPNALPVTVDDTIFAVAATPRTFDPRVNDFDANQDSLTIVGTTTPSHGSVSTTGTAVTYTSTTGYTGSDTFLYSVADGRGGTAFSNITVYVSSAARSFSISPAVAGKTTWDLDSDGPLNLSAGGAWTIVPSATFQTVAKAWGAGGGDGGGPYYGGGGGYVSGVATLQSGVSYTLTVGSAGGRGRQSGGTGAGGTPGGGAGTSTYVADLSDYYGGGGGGGYTAIRATSGGTPIVVAAGGGGGGWGVGAGAGGGSIGQDGAQYGSTGKGNGGTQTSGGAYAAGGTAGSAYQGGVGGPGSGTYGDPLGPGGGGGGAGYYGASGGGAGASGGGGSSYVSPTSVMLPSVLGGNHATPANASDSDRAGAGQGATNSTPPSAGVIKLR